MKRNSLAKYFALGFLACLLIPIILPTNQLSVTTQSQPQDTYMPSSFTPKTILFDESHCDGGSSLWAPGNASLFSWILDVNGYSSDTNFNDSLDSGILGEYDILVLFFPFNPLTPGEISAVLSFVDNGGGLLLVGTNYGNNWAFSGTNLNPIANTFGINFELDSINEVITSFSTHNITYGVTSLNTRGDDLFASTMTVSAPATSIIDSSGGSIVAAAESGLGRVVCVGGPSPFYMYRKNSAGSGDSHFQFSVNVIDWLSGNPERIADIPDWATITVGPGPSLSPAEVEEYYPFVGIYHEHTTHSSDGTGTPQEMVESGLEKSFDFMVMSDHSYAGPSAVAGITGGVAMNNIVEQYSLDMHVTIGAELSAVKHTVGFPLTSNIFTSDQQYAVDQIHAQGGIAIFAHPSIGFDYAPIYENFTEYGFDALEVDNRGFFFGNGEDGFRYNFFGGGDTHSASEVGTLLNAIFVKNPTGPNGSVSDADIVDAVLNKRVVMIDQYNDFIYGQEVWVQYYQSLMDDADAAVSSAQTVIDDMNDAGQDVRLSELYLQEAETAINRMNPGRAMRMAQNATSDVVLGLDFAITTPTYLEPNTGYEASVMMKNNHTYGVQIESSILVRTGITFDPYSYSLITDGKSTSTTSCTYESNEYGLMFFTMNLYDFNTTEYINPILVRVGGIVDNVTVVSSSGEDGYTVDFTYWMGRDSGKYIRSVTLVYDDGSGEQEVAMERGWDQFIYSLSAIPSGTVLDVSVVVETSIGPVYTIAEQTLTLGTVTTSVPSTTTPTTSNSTGGQPIDTSLLIILAGAGIGVVIVLIVLVKIRK